MALRETVQKVSVAAFKAIGNIARPATFKSNTGTVNRDIDSGKSTPVMIDYKLKRVLFTRFKEDTNDPNISVVTDMKVLFPAMDLPVKPKVSDLVIDENGGIWQIVRRLSDPASAVIILQVRTMVTNGG